MGAKKRAQRLTEQDRAILQRALDETNKLRPPHQQHGMAKIERWWWGLTDEERDEHRLEIAAMNAGEQASPELRREVGEAHLPEPRRADTERKVEGYPLETGRQAPRAPALGATAADRAALQARSRPEREFDERFLRAYRDHRNATADASQQLSLNQVRRWWAELDEATRAGQRQAWQTAVEEIREQGGHEKIQEKMDARAKRERTFFGRLVNRVKRS